MVRADRRFYADSLAAQADEAAAIEARRKNPPSRGAGCALQQECQRGSKPR